jgi:hypothetical protein
MRDRVPSVGLRSGLVAATAMLLTTTPDVHAQGDRAEVRALWVVRSTLSSPVHAWIDVSRVASTVELPLSRDHVVYRHPEWLMVPRALAADLLKVARRLGAGRVIFFSYDGLTGPSRGTEYLSQVGRAALMH